MNVYRTFYKGRTVDFTAATSLEAQTIAAKHFKARKAWDVSVVLIQKDGEIVKHSTAAL